MMIDAWRLHAFVVWVECFLYQRNNFFHLPCSKSSHVQATIADVLIRHACHGTYAKLVWDDLVRAACTAAECDNSVVNLFKAASFAFKLLKRLERANCVRMYRW